MSPIEDAPFPRGGGGGLGKLNSGTGAQAGLTMLLGPTLSSRTQPSLSTSSITEEVIGLYFSAHWCPPCRAFTPVLCQVYNTARTQGKSFQIVFCSQDRSQAEFDQYYAQMPWLAVPFENRRQVALVAQRFNLRGIPALILVNGGGQVLNAQSVVTQIRLSAQQFISSLPGARAAEISSASTNIINGQEVAGLTIDSALAALDTNMEDSIKIEGLRTIKKLCDNIITDSTNVKYHSLKKTNKTVQRKLADRRFIKLLKLASFDEYEDRYEFRAGSNIETLTDLSTLIDCILASYQDEPQIADTGDHQKEDGQGGSGWTCDGDVCRRND